MSVDTDNEEDMIPKTIVVYGLPGPQASSVACALLGNHLFTVRGVFSKECPQMESFREMGVECEVMEITDKSTISVTKLRHIFREAYGAFIVTNDADPPLAMRREMEVGIRFAEFFQRLDLKHVIYSTMDYCYRITGNRCPRYDGKGEIEGEMRARGLPLTVLKLPLSFEYLVNTFIPQRMGHEYICAMTTESNLSFDAMNYGDVGPVVAIAFERPNVFVGKTIGLTVDTISLNTYVDLLNQHFKTETIKFAYEKTTMREYQKNKKNNRELSTILDFHCNYAPLRDPRTTIALNPNVQTFVEYVEANKARLHKLFKLPVT